MERSTKTSVGVIGLGIIGSRVAAALRSSGYPVSVWSRSPRPEPNFLPSAREVAESADVLQIFVTDGRALIEVIGAIGKSLGESHIVMNHATISPSETLEAARMVADRGASFLDAPFTGSRDAAAVGQITYYVGGDESVLSRACPVLEASAKAILHLGPIGSATWVKLATNMISAAQVEALAEAMALLDRGGVPPEMLAEALRHNVASSEVISAKLPQMLAGDFAPRFTIKNMLKDLQIALRVASEHAGDKAGIDLPVTASTAGALMGAVQAGWSEDDFSSLARHYSYAGCVALPAKDGGDNVTHRETATPSSSAPSSTSPKKKSQEKKGFLGLFSRRSAS